ncbi:MAG: prepilin-type N-terminal cleavage/methylation domain-containing protein [Candidatus Brocadiae bacterium]|nr:prepilin-type N-terminal cleavage/methylation domain-containing protein [Candidatus Brocadiia bacterium]
MRRTRQAGAFTLVEVLITITITAIMIGILYGVLVATLQTRLKLETMTQLDEAGPACLKTIADDIAAAFVPPVPDAPPAGEGEPAPQTPAYFTGGDKTGAGGEADEIDFISSRDIWDPVAQRVADFAEIGYFLRPNPDDAAVSILVRREDPFVDDKPASGGSLQEIYDRVKSLSFEYYDGEKWLTTWGTEEAQKKALPRIVKIKLVVIPDAEKAKENATDAEKTFELMVSPVR